MLFIEQRGGLAGVKTESLADGILVVGEVVHLLRDIGQKNLIALIERNLVIAIMLQGLAGLLGHGLRLGGIAGLEFAQLRHMHVRAHVLMAFMVMAAAHGVSSGV